MTAHTKNVEAFRAAILQWYDRNRRTLPWRALPGKTSDPYAVWLSEVMLQQTTVPAVMAYFTKFTQKWPTVHDLANADAEDVMQNWAGLGYYARARNLHKCAKVVAGELEGVFPDTQEDLRKLPGIGDYTSNAIASIAFNKPAIVVDANVERVMARIFAITQPLPDCKPVLKKLAAVMGEGENQRPGDYAQALMDLGATICTPTSPKCMICPVNQFCDARSQGIAVSLPARKPKAIKRQRHGYIYWVKDNRGRILFERRGDKGMLGGTIGLPTSIWVDTDTEREHLPSLKHGQEGRVRVLHSFTHFDLELAGVTFDVEEGTAVEGGNYFWVPLEEAGTLGIPTLFKKALKQFI